MTAPAAVNAAEEKLARVRPATEGNISARLWLYPPRLRSGTVPNQAILAAAKAGVDIQIGGVSIGLEGPSHNVFTAIEQIFSGMETQADIALIATIQHQGE
jgi:hypothetical protein